MTTTHIKAMILSILIGIAVSSCTFAVCRHDAMRGVAIAQERNLEYRIVVYDVWDVFYDAHAQVQIKQKDEWKWYNSIFGFYYVSEHPETRVKNRIVIFNTAPEYLEFLKKYNQR